MIENFTFLASDNEKLAITTYLNKNKFSGNAVIFVHGFKGFKDWGFVPYLGNYFANNGFFVVTFNFSFNGIGENLTEFTELDKFSKNTISREIRELNEITDALKSDFFKINFKGKIGYIGHSRGGAVAILTASKRKDISCVSLWASISKLDRYTQRQKDEWRKKGYIEIINTRTKQIMKLNISLLEDIEKNSDDFLNIQKAISQFNRPILIVHGNQDMVVPVKEAMQLYEWSDKTKTEFFKIYGTGHTFDIVHPFNGSNDKFERVLETTLYFFQNNLK
ncbi:MAG: prolyl oligopeptidase family serine peptidase [Melioribacter sp.]|uniref:alpha/beta hydrolase family protein n=1 Tax=Rosettibacter primus TaxID=3111523 RepID=UPI00247BDF50|nr:prolyl oligopeptidase family serine peptidase [Melioribacter sp.]